MKRLLALVILSACATAPAPQPTKTPTAPAVPVVNAKPAEVAAISAIEDQLMAIDIATLRYYVETKGAAMMVARGHLLWRPDILRFDVSGHLGEAVGLLGQDAKSKRYEPEPIPANGKRAIVEGMVRMGLGHNLYRLLNGQDPEGVEGGLQGVAVSNVRFNEADREYLFDISVNGTRVGEARLWLRPDGRPLRREQTVHFPDGDMTVTENYTWIL